MTDNKIIELDQFRANRARALTLKGKQLLAATDLAAKVKILEPLEAYYIVREIGLNQALPILLQLNHEQLEACIDLDCWDRSNFAADSLDEWLTSFAQAGSEPLAQAFLSLDHVVQLLFLTQTITVYDPDTDQVPPVDEENEKDRAMTPDGFYLLELKADIELKIHPFSLLDSLYQYDSNAAHRLTTQVRVDLQTQIEEEALRFRNGRMMDIGFVGPDEAAVLFSRPSRQPLPRPPKPIDSALTRVPALYTSPSSETTLLQQALSLITDQESLSRLELEIVWAINSAIIAYGDRMQDTKLITNIAQRVRDTISLGLESLLTQQDPNCPLDGAEAVAKASELLDVWCINDLFRHGFAATMGLQKEVEQALLEPLFNTWHNLPETEQSDEPNDRLERAFVTALLGRHPLRGGFDLSNAEKVKAFACLADIDVAHVHLKRLVAQISQQS